MVFELLMAASWNAFYFLSIFFRHSWCPARLTLAAEYNTVDDYSRLTTTSAAKRRGGAAAAAAAIESFQCAIDEGPS